MHRPGDLWSVWRWHDGSRWLDSWYGNLESPWQRFDVGYTTQDGALDVVAEGTPGTPDWTVAFKDEDELAWLVDRGALTDGEATWLPDPSWGPTVLPPGWDRV